MTIVLPSATLSEGKEKNEDGVFHYPELGGLKSLYPYVVVVEAEGQKPYHRFHFIRSEACAELSAWTTARINLYFSKPKDYWKLENVVYDQRGWLTDEARRKFKREEKLHSSRIACLGLTNKSFRHGITLDWCYVWRKWNKNKNDREAEQMLMSDACPSPIATAYRKVIQTQRDNT